MIFGHNVDTVRRECGIQLARESPLGQKVVDGKVDRDTAVVVFAVPDSSNTAALGFADECIKMGLNVVYDIGLIRNHYVGRTFISPGQDSRDLKVRLKFNTVERVIKGKEVVMVDDSIVRGTTSRLLIKMVRAAGATKIHFRVASPPVKKPCFYGMDFPTEKELIANKMADSREIAETLGADTVEYLSMDGVLEAIYRTQRSDTGKKETYCDACFTGNYPVDVGPFDDASSHLLVW